MKIQDIPYIDEIITAADRWGLDPLMVAAVVKAESGFRPDVVSPAGAVGLMQLMPKTDKWLDGDIDGKDPEGNLDNGCRMLDWLRKYWLKKYPALKNMESIDLWKMVWAGYNAGPGNTRNAVELARTQGMHDFLEFDIWKAFLPNVTGSHATETLNYVRKVGKYWKEFLITDMKEDKDCIMVPRKQITAILYYSKMMIAEADKIFGNPVKK